MNFPTRNAAILCLFTAVICCFFEFDSDKVGRSLAFSDTIEFLLPDFAAAWCKAPGLPPLNYHSCDPNDVVYEIKFSDGLKMMLLSVIKAFEENRCFYLTEHTMLTETSTESVVDRYFEPIGLAVDDPVVVRAMAESRTKELDWLAVWEDMDNRRSYGTYHTIPALGISNMEGNFLKKIMLQRMWRLKPFTRAETCLSLESHGLEEDFIAMNIHMKMDHSIPLIHNNDTKVEDFIAAAEERIDTFFGGVAPKIFVATNDCKVMNRFRKLAPSWTFVSECDFDDMMSMSHSAGVYDAAETDRRFRKFFIEIYAMAIAKVYIGSGATNMAWWAFLMRADRWSTTILGPTFPNDTVGTW